MEQANRLPNLRRSLLATLIASLTAQAVVAQEQPAKEEADADEEVVIYGVRRSLEDALDIKRNANAIVDHISAEDISSVPALNLGEALQAIPGIQVNAEGSRRESTINLRGLPGGYVRTTANGHSFATPSQSRSASGVSNPFGAFESSIFRGVTVYKSATADLDEGFISGIVDKKLPQALDRRRDELEMLGGYRYEQLNNSYDPEIAFRGTKHIIKDTLAITGALAWSEQNFRRDSVNITRYEPIDIGFFPEFEDWKSDLVTQGLLPSQDTPVLFPSEIRQFSEISAGQRYSYSFNVQWQVNDELKLGLDLLGSEKDLDEARLDINLISLRERRNLIFNEAGDRERLGYNLMTPTSLPFKGSTTELGVTNYVVSEYDFENAQLAPGARDWDAFEKTDGAFFTAEWTRDNWTVESKLATSQAEAFSLSTQFDARYRSSTPARNDLLLPRRKNGLSGRIRSGEGNFDNYLVEVNGWELLDLNNADSWRYSVNRNQRENPLPGIVRRLSNRAVIGRAPTNPDVAVMFSVASAESFVNRGLDSFGTDVEYEFNSSNFFVSAKGGFKVTREEFDRAQYDHSTAFINLNGISNELLIEPLYTNGNDFFNGNLPGQFGVNKGWLSIDVPLTIQRLQRGPLFQTGEDGQVLLDENGNRVPVLDAEGNPVEYSIRNEYNEFFNAGVLQLETELAELQANGDPTVDADVKAIQDKQAELATFRTYENPEFTPSGFLRRRGGNLETNVYGSKVDIMSMYAMANFESSLPFGSGIPVTGNFGLRYATTDLETQGTVNLDGVILPTNPTNSYSNLLPSFNMTMELTPDLLFRTAMYRGIVRPNIAFFRPSAGVNVSDTRIRIRESDTDVKPYTADSLDFTLEWYNRKGSAISVGLFSKWFKNAFVTRNFCPSDGGDYGFGELFEEVPGDPESCKQAQEYTYDRFDEETDTFQSTTINRDVNITRTFNADETNVVRGVETAIQQNLDFLPGFWSGFGGIINYSYVETGDSGILTGISEESYNFIGYWENKIVNTRLSYNWRSDYSLSSTSSFAPGARSVNARGRLDLSISARLPKRTRLTFRAYNLTDELYKELEADNSRMPRRTNYDGRTYSLNLSHRFF